MSVPKSQRGESRLHVHVELRKLVDHTLAKTRNGRKFGGMANYVLTRDHLDRCLGEIARMLGAVGMSPHPEKTRIAPLSEPIGFLGFDYRIRDGGVTALVKPAKVKEQRRRLRHMAGLVREGRMAPEDYLASLECMCNHLSKGDNAGLPERQRRYGTDVLRGATQ